MRAAITIMVLFALAACHDFVPREKVATVDAQTGEIVLPHPCPDWSQSASVNYDNAVHSNFGCAVNNNLAVQLENPGDLKQGYGSLSPSDTEASVRTIQRYRAGEIPQALSPIQESQP
jgi:pilus biogenesis lipoprotein CpaD